MLTLGRLLDGVMPSVYKVSNASDNERSSTAIVDIVGLSLQCISLPASVNRLGYPVT